MKCPSPYFQIKRLKNNAALLCPETLESENETLKSFYISRRRCW
jgi:hypothetical protein